MRSGADRLRAYLVIASFIVVGVASAAYVVSNQGQGIPVPGRDVFTLSAEFTAADGVVSGIGQPVNVAGVSVGRVTDAELVANGDAIVTMEIERDRLPEVRADATAALVPVTPLKDMSIELNPGRPPAKVLSEGALISRARPPVALSEILAGLDADSRRFLTTMISGLDQGTAGRAGDLREMLTALGPTTRQAAALTHRIEARRKQLSRLVHNLARVTRAAARDGRLVALIEGGNRTLGALAEQQLSLAETLARLPSGLRSAKKVLDDSATVSDELGTTATELIAPVGELPETLDSIRPLVRSLDRSLHDQVRPLVRESSPVIDDLGVAVPKLSALAPDVTSALQSVNYTFNELAFNPKGDDEGYLYWIAWAAHNFNSATSMADAHGGFVRSLLTLPCSQGDLLFRELELLVTAPLPSSLCPPGAE